MARRYEQITELYRQSIREITSRPENWTSFLCSACRNYRLPFDELVLIYARARTPPQFCRLRAKTDGTSGLGGGSTGVQPASRCLTANMSTGHG